MPSASCAAIAMRDHLRFAVCYWHTFCWRVRTCSAMEPSTAHGFAAGDSLALAERKAEAAFELFAKLGVPFFTFHDRDVAPEGATLAESNAALDYIVERLEAHMARTGVRLLWGTANLFSHRRYAAGAATNPDPDVFRVCRPRR